MRRKFLLWMMLAVIAMDICEIIIHQELLDPWYTPIFMAFLTSLVILSLVIPKPLILRACGWILFLSILGWSAIVRNILVS